jgi:hypothetical protein
MLPRLPDGTSSGIYGSGTRHTMSDDPWNVPMNAPMRVAGLTAPDPMAPMAGGSPSSDPDPIETAEWLEALASVVEQDGPARARFLLDAVQQPGEGSTNVVG